MRLAFAVALIFVPFFASAGNLTGYLPANISTIGAEPLAQIEVLSLNYHFSGVSRAAAFDIIGTADSPLLEVSCAGPSQCSCSASGAEFSCRFMPQVSGTYSLQFISENMTSAYYLELSEGKQAKLTSVQESDPPASRWAFYAMAALGVVFIFYLAYLAYGRLTRKRRNLRQLLQKKIEVEHDMEALRYRYMKREIDEITLAQLMQQKKLELIQLNSQLEEARGG